MHHPVSFNQVYSDGMEATKHLRDTVYMSPQLLNLTNTLRSKKKCQGGHAGSSHCNGTHVNDSTILPESEVVFRAVSPHGHVYWEIDPKRDFSVPIHHPAGGAGSGDECQTSSSDMSSSRQSSSRYSDNHPLITDSPLHHYHPNVLVNPFADVQLLSSVSASSSPTSAALRGSSSSASGAPETRFSSLRMTSNKSKSMRSGIPNFGSSGSPRSSPKNHSRVTEESLVDDDLDDSGSTIPEQLQRQVQIRDLRAIQGNVKSNEYILAKIQNQMSNRGSPIDLQEISANSSVRGSPKQRKV